VLSGKIAAVTSDLGLTGLENIVRNTFCMSF